MHGAIVIYLGDRLTITQTMEIRFRIRAAEAPFHNVDVTYIYIHTFIHIYTYIYIYIYIYQTDVNNINEIEMLHVFDCNIRFSMHSSIASVLT
jgi:hypothetical protein